MENIQSQFESFKKKEFQEFLDEISELRNELILLNKKSPIENYVTNLSKISQDNDVSTQKEIQQILDEQLSKLEKNLDQQIKIINGRLSKLEKEVLENDTKDLNPKDYVKLYYDLLLPDVKNSINYKEFMELVEENYSKINGNKNDLTINISKQTIKDIKEYISKDDIGSAIAIICMCNLQTVTKISSINTKIIYNGWIQINDIIKRKYPPFKKDLAIESCRHTCTLLSGVFKQLKKKLHSFLNILHYFIIISCISFIIVGAWYRYSKNNQGTTPLKNKNELKETNKNTSNQRGNISDAAKTTNEKQNTQNETNNGNKTTDTSNKNEKLSKNFKELLSVLRIGQETFFKEISCIQKEINEFSPSNKDNNKFQLKCSLNKIVKYRVNKDSQNKFIKPKAQEIWYQIYCNSKEIDGSEGTSNKACQKQFGETYRNNILNQLSMNEESMNKEIACIKNKIEADYNEYKNSDYINERSIIRFLKCSLKNSIPIKYVEKKPPDKNQLWLQIYCDVECPDGIFGNESKKECIKKFGTYNEELFDNLKQEFTNNKSN